MSDDDDYTEDTDGVKDLRKQFKEIQKQLADRDKELNQYRAQQRTATVAEVLKAKGIPASAAKLYNGEDASEDAVNKWVEEYSDIFGSRSADDSPEDPNSQAARDVANASYAPEEPFDNPGNGRIVGNPEELLRQMQTLPVDELIKRGLMQKR